MSQREQAALIVAAIGFLAPVIVGTVAAVVVLVWGAVWAWKRGKE